MPPMIRTAPQDVPLPYPIELPTDLPYEDNENMDSPWHRSQMELLIHLLETSWKGRNFYCGGNMFIHFNRERARNRDFRGPDFFVVQGVDHDKPRLYWAIWDEGNRYPDVIVELLSPTTEREDRTTKKDIYEQTFKTHEYFMIDPETWELEGWRLDEHYRAIPKEEGRLWSEELEMWLGPWKGTWDGHESNWLRLFDRDGNMLPTAGEQGEARAEAEAARAQAEAARAEAEAVRADAMKSENERLRQELEALRGQLRSNQS
jgi:Uma2 family endonuclease